MADKDDIGLNPLIGTMPGETIEKVRAVLAYVQWTKTTEADVTLGGLSLTGEYLVLECCMDALAVLFEAQTVGWPPRKAA